MKYSGEFNSIDGRGYRIEIITSTAGAERKLKLSGTPFISSVKGEDKTIYAPIRCGGATVGILSENYIFDLYSGEAKGVKVTLHEEASSGDIVRWTGYISPTIYDQGYDENLEEISLDCVDGVAVLKDIPFRTAGKGIMTFLDIIFKCLRESGCFKAFYISDNVQLTADGKEPVIEKFRVSTSNFFDRRKDMAQTDDDLAWSCYDVLYHILQWLGYTLTVEGDEVYILDYDSISGGMNTYHRYSLEGTAPGSPTYITRSSAKNIQGSDYSSNGTRVSLDEIYNKVTVKDEFNTYDNLFPTFGDENFETNLTAGADASDQIVIRDGGAAPGSRGYMMLPKVLSKNLLGNTVIDVFWQKADYITVFRFMDSPVFTFHKYNGSKADVTSNSSLFGEGKMTPELFKSYNGAYYLRMDQFKDEKGDSLTWLVEYAGAPPETKYEGLIKYLHKLENYTKQSLKPVIVLRNAWDNRFGPAGGAGHYNDMEFPYETGGANDETKNYPFVSLKDQTSSSIFGGKNHILRIKGKIRSHSIDEYPFPIEWNVKDYKQSNYGGKKSYYNFEDLNCHGDRKFWWEGYIWCMVKWGAQWWNGKTWSTSKSWFKLYYWNPEKRQNDYNVDEYFNQDFDICNNESSGYPGEEGYIIPAPISGNLDGIPEVAFTTRDMAGRSKNNKWHPEGTLSDNRYSRYLSKNVFISDLSITAEVSPGLLSDADLNSDTCYTNVIENGSLSPMDEISFKVCTDDGKKPSYSSVDIMQGSESLFVTALYNKALRNKERGTEGCDGLDAVLRQEEHMVFKLASQYEKPRVKFECNLHNEDFPMFTVFTDSSLGVRKFILTEKETDYRFNSSALTITEKE